MGGEANANIAPVTGGATLAAALAVYERVFPGREREPRESIEARIAAGRYECLALSPSPGAVAAMSITDQRPMLGCTVLTFLAVAPERRRQGLGTTLLSAVIERFRAGGPGHWLFVEARQRPAHLYRRCGFRRLAMDYHVPHYGAEAGCEAMSLMALPRAADHAATVDGALVAAMVRDAFVDGYGLEPGDARLAAQLARIPARVELEGC